MTASHAIHRYPLPFAVAVAAVSLVLAVAASRAAAQEPAPAAGVVPASVALEPVRIRPAAEPATVAEGDGPVPVDVPRPPRRLPTATAVEPSAAAMVARLLGTRSLDATLSAVVMFGVASLAPAVLLMTTCFVRLSIVLALVRQGLGTPHLPSNQILTSLALFLSALVMWPVWTAAYREGVEPYQQGRIELSAAYEQGTLPVRRWMSSQIEQAGNRDTMLYFLSRHPAAPKRVATYDDVPVECLLPAFLVSELKVAFAIGFRLLLPFLVLDVLVATLVVSTGLVMLPPTLVSLPLKLMVFVAADGWTLVVRSLLDGLCGGSYAGG
jgi:flagellar biosynthetic protein FliP